MPYVRRENRAIVGIFANLQAGYAERGFPMTTRKSLSFGRPIRTVRDQPTAIFPAGGRWRRCLRRRGVDGRDNERIARDNHGIHQRVASKPAICCEDAILG